MLVTMPTSAQSQPKPRLKIPPRAVSKTAMSTALSLKIVLAEAGPVVVTVFDSDRIADYQKMVAALRGAGIRAELYLGSGKFGAQMKYADKRGSPCAVIQGADEKAKGEVQIKDLIIGAQISDASGNDRDEHLQAQAKAQFAAKESELVEKVREVLARHNVPWAIKN